MTSLRQMIQIKLPKLIPKAAHSVWKAALAEAILNIVCKAAVVLVILYGLMIDKFTVSGHLFDGHSNAVCRYKQLLVRII